MASAVAMMVGGEVLNATTFVGGSYLAKYLSGNDTKEVLYEKERHDKALEKYQRDMQHTKRREKISSIGKMRIEVATPLHLVTLQIRMRL